MSPSNVVFVFSLAVMALGFFTRTLWLMNGALIIWIVLFIIWLCSPGGGGDGNYDNGSPGTQG